MDSDNILLQFPRFAGIRLILFKVAFLIFRLEPRMAMLMSTSPVYLPVFAGTHCAYPLKDGWAELN